MRAALFIALLSAIFYAIQGIKCFNGSEGVVEGMNITYTKTELHCADFCFHTDVTVIEGNTSFTQFGCGTSSNCKQVRNGKGWSMTDEDKKMVYSEACCDTNLCNSSPMPSSLFAVDVFALLTVLLLVVSI